MQLHEIDPPEALRDSIQGIWHASIDFSEAPEGFEILPDGSVEIVFHFGNQCSMSSQTGRQPLDRQPLDRQPLGRQPLGRQPLPSPFIVGLLGQPFLLHAESTLEVIGIKCFPWTVFDLLGLPSDQNGVRTFEHPVAGLQPILAELVEAGKIDEALNVVKQYFIDARAGIAASSMLFKAGVAMRKAKGNMPVSQVAEAAHATVRTLERNFKQSSGHTVKDVSALLRFEQVRDRLCLQPQVSIDELADEVGYTDRSHLSREFKKFSGATPAAFARKAAAGKMALSVDFVAFIQT